MGVSDLWNRSVASKDYHLTGSPRTGMLAASIRGHRRRRWTSTRPGRPGRGDGAGHAAHRRRQGGTPAGTRWAAVLAIVGAGVVAALQVAIIAAPLLRRDGLDLAAVGSLTAVFSVLGMVGGIAAGGAIARFGARRMLLLGLAATALGTAAGAAAPGYSALLASRVLEGLGFLMITVAGPAALQRLVTPARRDLAFALWSCYMPGHGRRHAGLAGLRGLACVLVVRGRGGAAGVGLRGAAGATVRRRRKLVLARPAAGHDRHAGHGRSGAAVADLRRCTA